VLSNYAVSTDASLHTCSTGNKLNTAPLILNYTGEYRECGQYCDTCQAAVTVIRSSDAALKFGPL